MSARRILRPLGIGLALALLGAGSLVYAQIEGSRGAAPIDSSGSFEVSGITVDVRGEDAEAARQAGWKLAQRKGWAMLSQRLTRRSGSLSDSALNGLVTGIVVENEQIGPNRYIARLGVLFDRNKAGAILGVAAQVTRSPPMLIVPIEWSGGAGRVYERTTAWQEAWARFRTGNSAIDYVRPRGTGVAPLLVNAGQSGRRGRGWWRTVRDTYGARDVLSPEVLLRRDYPGGPITGIFTASHGPDRQRIAQFARRVNSAEALPALLDAGVARIDRAYQDALSAGILKTDRLLAFRPPDANEDADEDAAAEEVTAPTPTPAESASIATYSVQVDTPGAADVTASEAAVRGVPGVRSANTTSLALGGISVMRVQYDGSLGSLRAALEARGWTVQEGPGVLRIRRAGASAPPPAPPPPDVPPGE